MPIEIRIPRLGWSMEAGTFLRWLRANGDNVLEGEPLFELEGEKALTEVEATSSGTLHLPPNAPIAGSSVAVGSVIGYLLQPGEAPPQMVEQSPQPETRDLPGLYDRSSSSLPLSQSRTMRHVASPRARRVAKELCVDWTTLTGTGREGRVREADVRGAYAMMCSTGSGDLGDVRTSRRKTIAQRLRRSWSQSIPVTLATTVDATEMVSLRERLKSEENRTISYADIVALAAARTLVNHPALAVRWNEKRDVLSRVTVEHIHIGLAVDTADGLFVPVLRDVARRSLRKISETSQALVTKARAGRLSSAEMQGSVLTISNLGAYGIEVFTPILNENEVAIIGIGAIRSVAAVLSDDRIATRRIVSLCLTFDHAAVDGAPAAAFLRDVGSLIARACTLV